jgi:hypothetical protein
MDSSLVSTQLVAEEIVFMVISALQASSIELGYSIVEVLREPRRNIAQLLCVE